MNKKQNHISARQAAEKAVIRDEQNRRIRYAATNPVPEVLKELHTTLCGLDMEEVSASRTRYGSNKVTHEKKESLLRRLADAFINPFTAILFGSGVHYDRHGFPVLFPVRECAGGL